MPRRLRSNSHANDEILEPGSTEAFVVDNQHPSKRRYTTLTTNTTPSSPDGISTTLSAFHFVDEDPWSSTEYEREVEPEDHRISISSAVYSQSYYDPYDVLPTPRTVPSLPYSQSGHPEVIVDTMRRNARNNYSELEDRVSFMELISPTTESKPPLPTTPKPDFSTLYSAGRSSRSLERRLPNQEHGRRTHKFSNPNSRSNSRTNSYDDDINMQLPPTSNNLDPLSRADLVRKSRKLAQVFGQTPNGASLLPTMADTYPMRRSFLDITSPTSSRHHISNSVATFRKTSVGDTKQKVKENMDRVKGKGIWPPPASTHYISATSGRRHSTPLTPDDFDFLNELHLQEPISSIQTDREASSIFGNGEDGNLIEIGDAQQVEGDSASFIDWDDELPGPNGTKNKHPAELQTQSPPGSQNSSRRSSVSSLAFASPSAYPGGAPRNSFTREDYIGTELPAAPFDDTDDEGGQKRDIQQHLARQPSLISLITPSLMSPEERAEAEKRRKREKLAKLHRFLGSRVPAGLVLGLGQAEEDSENGLPGLSASSMGEETDAEGSSEEKRSWKKGMVKVTRRRSGSESGVSSDWSDIRDRRKDDMGEDERLRMVKRAIRLEKVFGVAPPQTLYAYGTGHVPHYHSLSSPGVITPSVGQAMIRSSSTGTTEAILTLNPLPPNRGHTRPASREFLLPKGHSTDQQAIEVEVGDVSDTLRVSRPRGASLAYTHYEHSLNSLGDILDRVGCLSIVNRHARLISPSPQDDRASLKELHEILYRAGDAEQLSAGFRPEPNQDFAGIDGNLPSNGSGSARSERRLSLPALPARTSIASLNSLDSVGSILSKVSFDDADVEASEGTFQVRRRRAAKLTQFFGVDYRDLVQDVLDSIENGVEMEKGRGLSRQEAEDLLRKLRTIKGKRTGVFS
ncbi:hypothetical protein C8J55DRAFT_146189 [Lentinula edodes]|uniref:Uncharacterized protein n=1 Tax=Lentinula lateritia TaxID=40482 RepID=A0A9W9DIP5_9AGAR|nr:hypothetical protein C8J55DRAFT_146189 [Lentinula edodes]